MMAFCGPDLRDLYVTSATHGKPGKPHEGGIFRMRVDVPGHARLLRLLNCRRSGAETSRYLNLTSPRALSSDCSPDNPARAQCLSHRQTVVVTGASAGVGRAIAVGFGKRGWQVAVIARGQEGLESTKREIEATGGKALRDPG